MKRLRPKPFRGVSILDDATVIGIVSINSDLEIAAGEIPSRTAAFLVSITSQVLRSQAKEADEALSEELNKASGILRSRRFNSVCRSVAARYQVHSPHLIFGNDVYVAYVYVAYAKLILATREGWWQVVPADPYYWIDRRIPVATLNYELPQPAFTTALMVKRGPTSFNLGPLDRRMIVKAIQDFLNRPSMVK